MYPLLPIQPKLPLLRLLWGAFILFLSFHDRFEGAPGAVKGVLAAPIIQNQNILPAQEVDLRQLAQMQGVTLAQLEIRPTQPGMLLAHPGMQPATLPPPAQLVYPANQFKLAQSGEQPHPGPQPGQSVHPHPKAHSFHPTGSEPATTINLHLNRKNIALKPQDGWDKPDIGTEKLSLQAGDYFSISLPPAYSSLNKGGRHVSSVVYGPGLGGTKHLPPPRMMIGTLTYKPDSKESTVKSALTELLRRIEYDTTAETNLFFLNHVLSIAKEKFEEVVLNKEWYYSVAWMLHEKATGAGAEIPKNDVKLQKVYRDMLAKIVEDRSALDDRLLAFKQK
ncbi:hypothetical protein F5878DRAFT_662410 [Lentinula raphanica]|uniref:Uncharacterized protein n=1 Tax=Lentinula raphanica TaxID=153919 RepID=A0AA38P673_9AGAR|nr:hypothetical protein F5878DRAFT_662410 [Lentinula raphanica]